jgi:hypothetical protein
MSQLSLRNLRNILKHCVLILMLIDGMDYAGNFKFCLEPFEDRGLDGLWPIADHIADLRSEEC